MVIQRNPCAKVHLDGGSTARTLPSVVSHLGEVVVTGRLRSSRTVCWAGTTRGAVSIDVVERMALAMGQVAAPAAESSGALV
jgi:hypothetical protein